MPKAAMIVSLHSRRQPKAEQAPRGAERDNQLAFYQKTKDSLQNNLIDNTPKALQAQAARAATEPETNTSGAPTGNRGHLLLVTKSHTATRDKLTRSRACAVGIDVRNGFPGARKMGLPFREAVETFIKLKFGGEPKKHMKRELIVGDDCKLDKALGNYRRLYGQLPFDIISQRDDSKIDIEKFKETIELLIDCAPPQRREKVANLSNQLLALILN